MGAVETVVILGFLFGILAIFAYFAISAIGRKVRVGRKTEAIGMLVNLSTSLLGILALTGMVFQTFRLFVAGLVLLGVLFLAGVFLWFLTPSGPMNKSRTDQVD